MYTDNLRPLKIKSGSLLVPRSKKKLPWWNPFLPSKTINYLNNKNIEQPIN